MGTGQKMKNYSNRPSVCVGATLIVLGCLAIAAEVVRKVFIENAGCDDYCLIAYLMDISAGIWCGTAFVVFGVCAIISGKLQRKCLVFFHGFLSITTIVFAFALIGISGANVVMGFVFAHPSADPPYHRVDAPCWSNNNNNYGQTTPYYWRPWYRYPTTPNYWQQWYGYRTTPDYWRQWYGERTTPDYWRQWYGERTTPDYWRQWYGERTTPDYWRQWYGERSTPNYWQQWYRDQTTQDNERQWYGDRSTSDWRSWFWGSDQKATTENQWIRWFFDNTTPKSNWRDGPSNVTTAAHVTTSGPARNESRDSDDVDPFYYFQDESYDYFSGVRRKRQWMSDCWTWEIHVPFLTQLVMSCLLIGIGVLVAILSIITATTACIPFCCPPKRQDQDIERQIFYDGSSCPVFDVVSQVPKPETETRDSTNRQSSAAEIVTGVTADDVPLLMDDADSRILHV